MYIVNCEVSHVSDRDLAGKLLLKPVVEKMSYAKVFETFEEVRTFLTGEVVREIQMSDDSFVHEGA